MARPMEFRISFMSDEDRVLTGPTPVKKLYYTTPLHTLGSSDARDHLIPFERGDIDLLNREISRVYRVHRLVHPPRLGFCSGGLRCPPGTLIRYQRGRSWRNFPIMYIILYLPPQRKNISLQGEDEKGQPLTFGIGHHCAYCYTAHATYACLEYRGTYYCDEVCQEADRVDYACGPHQEWRVAQLELNADLMETLIRWVAKGMRRGVSAVDVVGDPRDEAPTPPSSEDGSRKRSNSV